MDRSSEAAPQTIAIIGGGPAGLMAASGFAAAGLGPRVTVFDAKPSMARKFLLAGRSGLNLTHAEPLAAFTSRYGDRQSEMAAILAAFSPDDFRAFLKDLGVETFVGSSGRVFPTGFKASGVVRLWLAKLAGQGVTFAHRHRWTGFAGDGACLNFDTPQGPRRVEAKIAVLALGGASWPRMGSDGAWVETLREDGAAITPLAPSNCGFEINWSDHFRTQFEGMPVKTLVASCGDVVKAGEMVVTNYGVEGGVVYALAAALRSAIAQHGAACLKLDLKRDLSLDQVRQRLAGPRGGLSLSNLLKKRLGLAPIAIGLLREAVAPEDLVDGEKLARHVKELALTIAAPRPIAEAISTAGGVSFAALDEGLMLKHRPGVYVAGEMLDWDAPTGGYLLQACVSTGWVAAQAGAARWGDCRR